MTKYDKIKYEHNAVVSYIFNRDNILLIHKKRGLGAGKINVPGGHIEINETPYEAAVRETMEEVSLTISDLELKGYLYFKFTNGLTMKGWVYKTHNYIGIPTESSEAKPFWQNKNDLPYDKMWADDKVWIPEMLNDRFFRGYFEFNDDIMLKREIEFYDSKEEFNS